MALSYKKYLADGVTTLFSIPFPYLDRSHVQLFVDGSQSPYAYNISFPNAATMMILPPPGAGKVVEIRRVTPTGLAPVDFNDNSVLQETDLDLISKYSAFVAEEAKDAGEGSLKLDFFGRIDVGNRKITNVVPGEAPTDAVTVSQLNGAIEGPVQGWKDAAQAAATSAATSAATATSKAAIVLAATDDPSVKAIAADLAGAPNLSVDLGFVSDAVQVGGGNQTGALKVIADNLTGILAAASHAAAALVSKGAAQGFATDAAGSATLAGTKASDAATSAGQAAASATAAANSAASIANGPVASWAGLTGTITAAAAKTALALVKGDVGLGNVDNTSDANKPISSATQTALNAKAPLAAPVFTGLVDATNGGAKVKGLEAGVDGITVKPASGNASVTFDRAGTTQGSLLQWKTAGSSRWQINVSADAAHDFYVQRFNDSGTYVDAPLWVRRSDGMVSVGNLTASGNLTVSGTLSNTGLTNALAAKMNISGGTFTGSIATNGGLGATNTIYCTNGDIQAQYASNNGGVISTGAFLCNPSWNNVYFQGVHVPGNWAGGRIVAGSQVWDFRNDGVAYGNGWNSTSDRRLKENIAPITDALEKLRALTGCTYDRPDMKGLDGSTPRMAGLIAQDVQAVLPEAVTTDPGEFAKLSLDYNGPIAILVQAVKELEQRVAALQAQLDASAAGA